MDAPSSTKAFARKLRRETSLPEGMLWKRLRLLKANGLRFRRQHPIGPYVLDFYCDGAKLAVEVDGAHHTEDERIQRDAERDAWCAARGIETLRIPAPEVLAAPDGCCQRIAEVAATRAARLVDRKRGSFRHSR